MSHANVTQGSEAWDRLRCGIPTASKFGNILTPKTLKPSESQYGYIAELIAQGLPDYTKQLPTFDMQRGTDMEPEAVAYYEFHKGIDVERVGFFYGDESKTWGGSPDGLIGDDGGLEVKCPKPEVQVQRLLNPEVPGEYLPQIFGYMLIADRQWFDFMSYHPDLDPVIIRIEKDTEFGTKTKVSFDKWVKAFVPALHEFIEKLEATKERLGVK
jgi:hypothetical protein